LHLLIFFNSVPSSVFYSIFNLSPKPPPPPPKVSKVKNKAKFGGQIISFPACVYQLTEAVGLGIETIREKCRLRRICTSHFRMVAELCRDIMSLWRVQSTLHPHSTGTYQQIHCHPPPPTRASSTRQKKADRCPSHR
jgi:hypothetical protein